MLTITCNGTPVGRLIPLRRRTFVPREEVVATFAAAPGVDADRLREDIDGGIDQNPFSREW